METRLFRANSLELKIPPVAQWIILAVSMWLMAYLLPSMAYHWPRRVVVLGFVAFGIAFGLLGLAAFYQAKTTFNPLKPDKASALVTNGIYRYSRNPMYVGLLLLLIAWGVYLSHLVAFVFVPVFVVMMNRWQIIPEERAMSLLFSEEYERYRRRVRRWL